MSSTDVNPSDESLLRKRQVSPLPIGPGGDNPVKRQMNETNIQLTMLTAQAEANTKYDPDVPVPVTNQVIMENFSSGSIHTSLMVISGLLIVYGIVAK